MDSLTIDKKTGKIKFQDQNKKMVYLFRFILGLNLINALVFFLIFNQNRDVLSWIWLIFAVLNIFALWFFFTRISMQNEIGKNEIQHIGKKSFVGLYFKLKNGKYRKIFVPPYTDDADKLLKMYPKK